MREEEYQDAVAAPTIIMWRAEITRRFIQKRFIAGADTVAHFYHNIVPTISLKGPKAEYEHQLLKQAFIHRIPDMCVAIEELADQHRQQNMEMYPDLNPLISCSMLLDNTIDFKLALEQQGIKHAFTPAFVKELILYRLEQE